MTPAARIGLFMLLGLIILGVFIIKIEDIPVGERGDRLTVSARFSSVAGLDRKAAVRIAGVRVGKVEAINLDGSEAVLFLSLDSVGSPPRGGRSAGHEPRNARRQIHRDPARRSEPPTAAGRVPSSGAPPSPPSMTSCGWQPTSARMSKR